MVQRTTRYPKRSKAIILVDADRYDDDDLPHEGGLALYDENLETLERRIAQLETGCAWSEDPPSRTRRLITNIEVEPIDIASEIRVYANFLVYKNARKLSRISSSAPARTCSARSTVVGKLPLAGSFSTRR
jgi:hypothetical protein